MEAEARTSSDLKIRFREEGGKHWTDALPIGNGRLGAMIYGRLHSETIHLNGSFHLHLHRLPFRLHNQCMFLCFVFFSSEDTLWTGTPADYTDSKAPEALSRVRNLVNRQQYPQATAAASALTGSNPSEVSNTLSIPISISISILAIILFELCCLGLPTSRRYKIGLRLLTSHRRPTNLREGAGLGYCYCQSQLFRGRCSVQKGTFCLLSR